MRILIDSAMKFYTELYMRLAVDDSYFLLISEYIDNNWPHKNIQNLNSLIIKYILQIYSN